MYTMGGRSLPTPVPDSANAKGGVQWTRFDPPAGLRLLLQGESDGRERGDCGVCTEEEVLEMILGARASDLSSEGLVLQGGGLASW